MPQSDPTMPGLVFDLIIILTLVGVVGLIWFLTGGDDDDHYLG